MYESDPTRPTTTAVSRARRWRSSAVLALVAAMMVTLSQRPADADIVDRPVPTNECLDSTASGVGFFADDSPKSLSIESSGPVVEVVVEWTGITTEGPPEDTDLDVVVNGPSGSESDTTDTQLSSTDVAVDGAEVYSYHSDITDLFGDGDAGTYDIELTPPPPVGPGGVSVLNNRWWGASVTVVYDTTPCPQIAQLIWKSGADYYVGDDPASEVSPTTDLLVYELNQPLLTDLKATVRITHGGAEVDDGCGVSIIWVATGTGVAPTVTDDLVDEDGTPVYPSAAEGVVNPFAPPSEPCPAAVIQPPVDEVRGGHLEPRYALVEMDLIVPAGSTWVALQLESPRDSDGHDASPEAGAWGGAGLLVVPAVGSAPGISLEKTVLGGADGACPGEEGTDELVGASRDDPVTYCFRAVNTGDTSLSPVVLDDPDLGIDQDDMELVSGDDSEPLLIGDERVYRYETAADHFVNTATVTGTPVDADGERIPSFEDVSDGNDAEVVVSDVAVEKTVLEGPDGTCPGVEGIDELVSGVSGSPVTYCFRVTNTGDTSLFPLSLDDPDLGITDADMELLSGDHTVPLDPGSELVYAYQATIKSDLVNVATVTGTPVENGQPIPDLDAVADDDDASVRAVVDNTPPVLTIPDDLTVEATGPDGATVEFEATAVDDVTPDPVVDCEPASGSLFPVGETVVECNATDTADNTTTDSFTISVSGSVKPFRFADVPESHVFDFPIHWIAEQGITRGCNPPDNDRYCPDEPATRGEIAAFLVRAFGYTDNGGGNHFTDTIGNTFETDIDRLYVAEITSGCNPPDNDHYCPDEPITRGQMAAYIYRTLNE